MAVKSSLGFPLAFFLLVSQMVVALGAVDNAACEPVYAPPNSVSAPPMDAPVYPPPDNVSTPPPVSPPVTTPPLSAPPVNAPPVSPPLATPPPPPPVVLHGCAGMCFKRCRLARPYRPCMRACGECCNKSLCVPGLGMKCDNWPTTVVIHGKTVACP